MVCRRLFEDLGRPRVGEKVAKAYADWCFERSARLPAEWLAVDSATTGAKARECLRGRFDACYPFHPIDCSVRVNGRLAQNTAAEIRQALADLDLQQDVTVVEKEDP